jgi:hypothetical protein
MQTMLPNNFVWPSREEWAKTERTPYADRFEDLGVSRCASDYATPSEIDAAITALKALYADEGRKLKAAKLAAGPLSRQPGETKLAHVRRYYSATTEGGRAALVPVYTHEERRQEINEAIKDLRNDTLPNHRSWAGVEDIIAPMENRWLAAHAAASEALRKEIEATPIDDAAWERELQRRASLAKRRALGL